MADSSAEAGVRGESGMYCFICNSEPTTPLSSKVADFSSELDKDLLSECGRDWRNPVVAAKEIKRFAFSHVLEVPKEFLPLEQSERGSQADRGGDLVGGGIKLCDGCSSSVRKARHIYYQLVNLVKEYRLIQKDVVEKFQKNQKRPTTGTSGKSGGESNYEWCTHFIRKHEYVFSGPFQINAEDMDTMPIIKEEMEDNEACYDNVAEDTIISDNETSFPDCSAVIESNQKKVKCESVEAMDNSEENDDDDDTNHDCYDDDDDDSPVDFNENDDSINHQNLKRQKNTGKNVKTTTTMVRRSSRKRKLVTKLDTTHDPQYNRTIKKKLKIEETPTKPKPNKNTIWCCLCGDSVPIPDILEHTGGHLVSPEHLHKCPNPSCPHVYPHWFALRGHLMTAIKCKKTLPQSEYRRLLRRERFNCKVCGSCKGGRVEQLFAHLNRVHEDTSNKKYSCPVSPCQESFTVPQSVQVHILMRHDLEFRTKENSLQKCPDCNKRFTVGLMEAHLKKDHRALEILKCNLCPYVFSAREYLIHHLYSVHQNTGAVYSCDICNSKKTVFKYQTRLLKHLFEEHQIGRKYECDICESQGEETYFWTIHRLRIHKAVKHQNEQRTCDICEGISAGSSNKFASDWKLQAHKIKMHGEEPFTCGECQKTFTMKLSLYKHEKLYHSTADRELFPCDEPECGRVYRQKKTLVVHLATAHGRGQLKHLCKECGKRFPSPKNLKDHYNAVHLGIKAYVCETCGEGFLHEPTLKNHKRIHTGERPFVCAQCGQQFRQSEVLQRHLNGHATKGDAFKPNGAMKGIRKRVER